MRHPSATLPQNIERSQNVEWLHGREYKFCGWERLTEPVRCMMHVAAWACCRDLEPSAEFLGVTCTRETGEFIDIAEFLGEPVGCVPGADACFASFKWQERCVRAGPWLAKRSNAIRS